MSRRRVAARPALGLWIMAGALGACAEGREPPEAGVYEDAGHEWGDVGAPEGGTPEPSDAGVETDRGVAALPDAEPTELDASAVDAQPEPERCAALPPAPTTRIAPASGEVFYAQIGLGGIALGESAILVGPDGTTVLIDVGNDSHVDTVVNALSTLAGRSEIDHVLVTHFHADHGDGILELTDRVPLRGRIIHRGLTDFTDAANSRTVSRTCTAARAGGASGEGLCRAADAAPCDPAAWSGRYPMVDCDALDTEDLPLGGAARLDFVASNGVIGGASYEATIGPMLTDDSNGENARSVVALLRHGAFRLLLTGDLTGGGSDTDDVESFYAAHLESTAGIDARGVDVLHAGHHGRRSSNNATWIDRLLPADGRSRNMVMGISSAHVGSPHREVLDVVLAGGRLGNGAAWTTRVAATGATASGLVNSNGGHVLVGTLLGGEAYAVQSVASNGTVLESRVFWSVGACP